MRTYKLVGLILIAALLAGCAPAASGTTGTQPATASPQATSTRLVTTATAAAAATHEPGCTVVSTQPTPTPLSETLIPPVNEQDWVKGKSGAYVTIVEYSDFQCQSCAAVAPALQRLVEKYPDDVRVVHRTFPLVENQDKSGLAAQAAEAAGRQGKFWPMHDLLFSRLQEWSAMKPAEFKDWLSNQAKPLGLDVDQFKKDLEDPQIAQQVQAAWEKGATFISSIPYVLINGEPFVGRYTTFDLNATVALTLLARRQFNECPPLTIDPTRQYLAAIETEKGKVTLELFADQAPLAVNNFIFLAKAGWYNGVTFHRVIPGFVAQAGDPSGTGFGGPGYAFDNELSNLRFDRPGRVGMANAGPGSNGSQFFMTFAPVARLDGGYTIFAQVIDGLDVLTKLTPRDPSQTPDAPPGDKILSVTIIEK